MRRVSVRSLRADLSGQLVDLPFVITKNGEEIAMCTQIVDVHNMKTLPKSVHKCECVHKLEEREPAPSKSVQRRLSVQKDAQWAKSSDKIVEKKPRPADYFNPMPKKGKK